MADITLEERVAYLESLLAARSIEPEDTTTIDELDPVASVYNEDLILVKQNGDEKKATVQNVKDNVMTDVDTKLDNYSTTEEMNEAIEASSPKVSKKPGNVVEMETDGLYVSEDISGKVESFTQEAYDKLPEAEKNDGKIREITDVNPKKVMLNGMDLNEQLGNEPIGAIIPFGGSVIPRGYLLCNGQAVSRADYTELFAIIGTAFGAGDGSSTFNVPDLRETLLVGAGRNAKLDISEHDVYELGQFKDDQLQGHHHFLGDREGTRNSTLGNGTGTTLSYAAAANTGTRGAPIERAIGIINDPKNGQPRTGSTTHGKQIGVNYVIKATNYTQATEDILDDNKITTGNVLSASKVVEMNSYSTEEIIVGKWIDGKPIYRKVINTSAKNLYSWQFIPEADNLSIKKIIKAMAMGTDAEYTDCTAFLYARRFPNGKFGFLAINWPIYATTIILEYTKTTD